MSRIKTDYTLFLTRMLRKVNPMPTGLLILMFVKNPSLDVLVAFGELPN